MKNDALDRCLFRPALCAVALGCGFFNGTAWAGTLDVTSSGVAQVVVALDGKIVGPTPISLPSVPAGVHEIEFRTSTFGPVAYTQSLTMPDKGGLTVIADLVARVAQVTIVSAPAAPATTPPIASSSVQAPVPPAPPVVGPIGDLFVDSDPPAAELYIDGTDTGKQTPVVINGVKAGIHTVEVRLDCARGLGEATVGTGLIARTHITMKTGTGDANITTSPPGATVLIDDQQVGLTPYTAKSLSCGVHKVDLRAPGFLQGSGTLKIKAFQAQDLSVTLAKEEFGTLVISPTPLAAVVSIDGTSAGTGPMTVPGVAIGQHEITVSLGGYSTSTQPVVVVANTVTRLDVALLPAKKPLPTARIAIDSGVALAGLGIGVLGLLNNTQAHAAYMHYLAIQDDAAAQQFYGAEVAPRRDLVIAEFVASGTLLAGSGALWGTTHFAAAPTLGGAIIFGRF